MKSVVLTGAGASLCLGYPTMAKFLDSLPDYLTDIAARLGTDMSRWSSELRISPETFDLEMLLARLEFLDEFSVLLEEGGGRERDNFLGTNFAQLRPQVYNQLDVLKRTILQTYDGLPMKDVSSPFRDQLFKVHFPFLQRLQTAMRSPVDFFTTNYDRSIEFLGRERREISVEAGFGVDALDSEIQLDPKRWDDATGEVIRLCHLHGTFRWQRNADGGISSIRPELAKSWPCVLLPRPQKGRDCFEYPFRDLYQRLSEKAEEADRIIAIGYSGRDPEITNSLLGGIRRPDQRVIVAMPDEPSNGWTVLSRLLGERFVHVPARFEEIIEDDRFWNALEAR